MKKISLLVIWLASLLVGCGGAVDSGQLPVGSDPHLDLLVAQAQLTGTAQAFENMVVGYTLTAQSWTATPSPVPTFTMTPSITPTATPNFTATIEAAQAEATVTAINLNTEKKKISNNFWAVISPLFLLALLLGIAYFAISFSRERRMQVIDRGENDMPLVVDRVSTKITDMDANPNHVEFQASLIRYLFEQFLAVKYGYTPQYPMITSERADAVKTRDQMINLKTRTRVTNAAVQKLLEGQGLHKALPESTVMPMLGDEGLFPLPSWDLMNGWNGEKNLLPFGITAKGLGLIDLDRFSHLATIGKTGEGKSRRFFRPLITGALAAGHRVLIIGKATDYFVFDGHQNSTLVKINQMTESQHAERYANLLKALVQEMNLRDEYLTSVHKSTWMHAGRERTFVILDEFGNALRLMPSGLAEQARIWVEGLVSEGRKVGFHVAVANQRATGMAGVLSQTGKAIFRVERDEEKAHKSLMGASDLREGYFYARFGDVQLAGAFEPTDEEIRAYLSHHQPERLPLEGWIEGVIKADAQKQVEGGNDARSLPEAGMVDGGQLTEGGQPSAVSNQAVDEIALLTDKARGVWHEGMSATKLALALGFSQYGGSHKLKVDKVIERLRATTTPQNTPEMPVFEGI